MLKFRHLGHKKDKLNIFQRLQLNLDATSAVRIENSKKPLYQLNFNGDKVSRKSSHATKDAKKQWCKVISFFFFLYACVHTGATLLVYIAQSVEITLINQFSNFNVVHDLIGTIILLTLSAMFFIFSDSPSFNTTLLDRFLKNIFHNPKMNTSKFMFRLTIVAVVVLTLLDSLGMEVL